MNAACARPLLTREGELDRARRLVAARDRVATLVLGTPLAVAHVGKLARRLQSGEIGPHDVVRPGTTDERGGRANREGVLATIQARLKRIRRHVLELGRSPHHAGARRRVASELGGLGLAWPVIEEIADELAAESRRSVTGLEPARLRSVVLEVEELRDEQQRARSDLVESNIRLVLMLAHNVRDRGMSLDDLVQEGTLGLLRAVDGFDPLRGYKFSTYAVWWIRQAISRALSDRGREIRIPVYIRAVWRRIQNARLELEKDGHAPTLDELAGETGASRSCAARALELVQQPVSLDTPLAEDGHATLVDTIAANQAPPSAGVEKTELHRAVESALVRLPVRDAEVLRLHYGIDKAHGACTFQEVGDRMDVSRERARQIEKQAMERLRTSPRLRELATK
jgi:RNA polymerase primary sigma factor